MFILVTSFGFIIGILLIVFREKTSRKNIWLALFFLSNVIYAVMTNSLFLEDRKWVVKTFFPYFITFNYSSGAFLFLYFIYKLNPDRGFKMRDLWHFLIPFLLFLNSTPFIFLKQGIRDAFLKSVTLTPQQLLKFPALFLEYRFHLWGRPILALIYIIICMVMLWRSYQQNRFKYFSSIEMRYLILLLVVSFVHYYTSTTSIVNFALHPNEYRTYVDYDKLIIIPRATFFVLLVSNLFFPQIIFQKYFPNTLSEAQLLKKSRIENTNLTVPQYDLANIDQVVKEYLGSKPFLRPGFSLFNFSEETKIPQHQLTYYLKVYHEQTFNDFKNNLRIQHAIELLESGVAKNHTLETISITCGFRSRTNFIDSFKKVTGKTPSDYLKS